MGFVDIMKVNNQDTCVYILNSLYSDGSTETDLFCECLENVVNDCSLTPRQTDPLNILEPWTQVVAIDNGQLVCIYPGYYVPSLWCNGFKLLKGLRCCALQYI